MSYDKYNRNDIFNSCEERSTVQCAIDPIPRASPQGSRIQNVDFEPPRRNKYVSSYSAPTSSKYRNKALKRALDLVIAIPALVFLMPFMTFAAIMVRLADGGPAIFSQERVGLGGNTFRCLKFRSMIVNSQEVLQEVLEKDPIAAAEWAADQKLRNDPRITKIGAFLRKTSLDELPQLINVIRGEMSIVGPRPIIREEIPRYGSAFTDYKSVRPGLTGLWQISGRNDTTYPERVEMDRTYARTHSNLGDIGIILRTVPEILNARGAF